MKESTPRLVENNNVGQVDATIVPRYGGAPTFARLPRWDEVDRADVVEVCDSLVRLTVSHLVLPLAPAEVTAVRLARLAQRFLAAPAPSSTPSS